MAEYTVPRYRDKPDRTELDVHVGRLLDNWNQLLARVAPTFRELVAAGLLGVDEAEDLLQSIQRLGRKLVSIEERTDRIQQLSEVSQPERISLTRARRDLTKTFPTHEYQVHQMYQVIDHLYGMGEISSVEREQLLDRINRYDRLVRGMIGTLEKLRYES